MKRGVHPAPQFIAGQAPQRQFVDTTFLHQLPHALVHFGRHILHAQRDAQQHRLRLELRDEVLEGIPARGVGALQVVQHDHERTMTRRLRDVGRELAEQRELAARRSGGRGAGGGGGEARDDAREFRPVAPVVGQCEVRRKGCRTAH